MHLSQRPLPVSGQGPRLFGGIRHFVNELAGTAGINYINGANTVTYFGGLACDSEALQRLLDAEAV